MRLDPRKLKIAGIAGATTPDYARSRLLSRLYKVFPLLLLVAVAAALALLARALTFSVSEERVREHIIATVQSEARQSFLVTGSLDITATTTIENSRDLLPRLLDINLGT